MDNIMAVTASELTAGVGQIIVNTGDVMAVRPEGAFVYVEVQRQRWSPVSGTLVTTRDCHLFHSTDTLYVWK